MAEFAVQRKSMIDGQLRPNKISNQRLLQAFEVVPRELFVPPAQQSVAYVDEDIAIGDGRFMLEPMILGRLLQEAMPEAGEKVLVLGSGMGYAAALLSEMGLEVHGLESDSRLLDSGRKVLGNLGYKDIQLHSGDLTKGCTDAAPYDLIIGNGAVTRIYPWVSEQLRDNGRMVTVMRASPQQSQAFHLEKISGRLNARPLFDAWCPLLPGYVSQENFVF